MVELTSKISERDAYFIPCLKRFFSEEPILLVKGEGAIVTDSTGKEYVDLFAGHGVNFVGFNRPEVVSAIKDQAENLINYSYEIHTNPALELAEKLVRIAPEPIKKCYFLNSGAEAVECSFHLARKHTRKYEIVALYGGFHGRTYGARSALGWSEYKRDMGPFLPGFILMPSYYCYRCSLNLEYPGCNLQCARMLEDVLHYQCSGDVAALIAEPVQGAAGIVPAPDGYFKQVKRILDSYGILFIDDEVYTGLGRTGKLFGIEHHGVKPDIMTLAKTLGGGVPISAVMASEKVASAFEVKEMLYFTTYGGNPLCCAAALTSVSVVLQERMHERAARLGEYFTKGLDDLAEKYELIGDVRGKGLMIGVELVKDRRTKEPARRESMKLRTEAKRRGVILPSAMGWLENSIRMTPPAVITEDQIDYVIEVLNASLKAIG